MKHDTEQNVKFKRLKMVTGLPLWQCKGLLESIWHLTCSHAPEGDIGRLSNDDICVGIEYAGDPDELINALVSCGWLDDDDEHRLIVHDWYDHAPEFVQRRMRRQTISDLSGHVRTTSDNVGLVSYNQTKPNQTKPKEDKISVPTEPHSSGDEHPAQKTDDDDEFQEIITAWNTMADKHDLPGVRAMTQKRRKALRQRMREAVFRDSWQDAIDKIPTRSFLRGENDRHWKANFDWFTRPDTVPKIIEGAYGGDKNAGYCLSEEGMPF